MLSNLFKEILVGWVQATKEPFTDHPLANKLRKELKDKIQKVLLEREIDYKIKASAGAGNWANVPWLSMLDSNKTESTQEGIYPVYLFRADGSGFYLSLGFGTTKLKELYGASQARVEASKIAKNIHTLVPEINTWGDDSIDLRASTNLGRSYEWGSAGAIFYAAEDIPSDDVLISDLEKLINIYKKIPTDFLVGTGVKVEENNMKGDVINSISLPKPFILLAGISGTGKTRFVREQAKAFDAEKNNYCLVSVRPDWHEPSDLLGYVSRLSGSPKYISTKVLNFIIKAWQVAAREADSEGHGDLDYSAIPYWLCLDEMNLAPVEQYFADYLSVLESREFSDDTYKCEALLDKGLLQDLADNDAEIQKTLGLEGNDDLWQYFLNHGIAIPPNLIVAGTVNMDETTHGFSRKVIDRALTIDFGEFFPNDYANYFQQKTRPKCFSYSKQTQSSQDNLSETFDVDGSKSIAFLSSVNDILKHTPFELAYRALNELLLQVECFKPETEQQLRAVWDDFLMSKVLPRIDGDEDKLRVTKDDDTVINLLEALSELLEEQFGDIWNGTRFDFYRENSDGSVIDDIPCRSKAKLIWMQNRLTTNTFTSFWP